MPRFVCGEGSEERLAEEIPGCKLTRLPNVGRLVPEEAPETLVNLVIEFDSASVVDDRVKQ